MGSTSIQQAMFFPKADAAVLSWTLAPPPTYPAVVGPIFNPHDADSPCLPWSLDVEKTNYPPQTESYAPATIPKKQPSCLDRYLRPTLARNERLRLSMLWYYTHDIFKETGFLSGLQEKVCIAQESTDWEFAIIGILDVNVYKRLATVGVPLGMLPRGETLCGHVVAQPPGSVFLLPDLLEDWRFENSPYVESGGLRAYAGAPLRLQNETGDTVCLGSICVASPTRRKPLTRAQQTTLARLADWIVADIVQLTRARRQRERRRMVDVLAVAQGETDNTVSEEPVLRILQATYPGAVISLQTCKAGHIELKGRDPVLLSDFSNHLWEDTEHIDDFIAKSNHLEVPTDRVVRAIIAPCESVSGHSFLTVGSLDFRLIFDDIDAWFIQTCAGIISQVWQRRLLGEVMIAKEKFLRGFSHQLRTPIHGILGSVELLAEELRARRLTDAISKSSALLQTSSAASLDEDHGIYLDTIKRAGHDLISIINSMITLNRWADVAITDRQYATYTTYELETELAAEVQKVVLGDSRYKASIFFNHNLPPDCCSLQTDLGLLRDSLLPIIINAIQSTTEGLVVITISARPDSKELVVDIKDTGHGIPVEDHQRIFELYEQVDVYSTGAGLGLTLATRFAALLKGSIELVASEIDCGSHFRATFQEMVSECSDSRPQAESAIPRSANIPRRFCVVPSGTKNLSLSSQFGMSLICHGFTASDDVEDVLIVLDFVADLKQHRAAISRIPPNRIVLCPVPFPEEEAHFDDKPMNVVYIYGPFGTRAISSALKRTDEIITQFKITKMDTPRSKRDLPLLPISNEYASNDQATCEVQTSNVFQIPDRMVNLSHTEQKYLTHGIASADPANEAPNSPKLCQPQSIDNTLLLVPSHLENGRLPTPPADDNIADFVFKVKSPAETITGDDSIVVKEHQNLEQMILFPDPSIVTHPTALLVDDNDINLRVLQMYCKKRDLQYVCAKDGLEAIAIFQDRQERAATERLESPIQLVLMDLQMPMCDGLEATRRIRQFENKRKWGKSVVFVVTGQDSPVDRKAAQEAGSQEYHVKPVSMQTLDMRLKRYFPRFLAKDLL